MTLTREQVLEMGEGIELDKLVAIHVMGWETRKYYDSDDSYHEHYIRDGVKYENVNYPDRWQPSKYIESAWEVVEKLDKEVTVKRYEIIGGYRYWCRIRGCGFPVFEEIIAHGLTAPEAICKAALLTTIGEGT